MTVFSSLGSKRFRGVERQRKTEERDFQCFARAKNGVRAKKEKSMKNADFFVYFPALQIYDISYIHLHSSPSTGILRTHKVTSSQMA